MRKALFIVMALVLMASGLMVGCGGDDADAALKAVDVELSAIYPQYGGASSITLSAIYTITNPNDYMVTVDSMDISLSATGITTQPVAATGVTQDILIPANGTFEYTDTFTIEQPIGAYLMDGSIDLTEFLPPSMAGYLTMLKGNKSDILAGIQQIEAAVAAGAMTEAAGAAQIAELEASMAQVSAGMQGIVQGGAVIGCQRDWKIWGGTPFQSAGLQDAIDELWAATPDRDCVFSGSVSVSTKKTDDVDEKASGRIDVGLSVDLLK
ncbi:hypothetical protein ACFLX5_01390 [Chloroflexota bacterium]